jgi:hypothetical protein
MADSSNELQQFIRETLRQVKEGTKGHVINQAVHFKIAITKSTKGEGDVEIKVLGIGPFGGVKGNLQGEIGAVHASEVGFSVFIRDDEEAENAMPDLPHEIKEHPLMTKQF